MESATINVDTSTKAIDRANEQKYSKDEAAQLIGVSPITVWREVKRGRLGCYRVCGGRVMLIGKSHIEKYLLASEQNAEQSLV